MKRTIAVFAAAAVLAVAAACSQPVQPERFDGMRRDGGITVGSGSRSDADSTGVDTPTSVTDTGACETGGGGQTGSGAALENSKECLWAVLATSDGLVSDGGTMSGSGASTEETDGVASLVVAGGDVAG